MEIECNWFSVDKIHESGQCFRWEKVSDDTYRVPAYGVMLDIRECPEGIINLSCSENEYRDVWKNYFDMDFDYRTHAENACSLIGSDYLTNAVKYSEGIRIIRQELWETTVSFIISANNNIPRIRKILSALCIGNAAFPAPDDIISMGIEKIRECGTGYRDRYLIKAAEFFLERDVLSELQGLDYLTAKKYLMQITGVGSKVADCVCLFSLGYKDAFPRDVWIKRIEAERFRGRFPEELSLGGAGVLQQYLFYYGKNQ